MFATQTTVSAPTIQSTDTGFGAVGASVILPISLQTLKILAGGLSANILGFGTPVAH